jgi:hypothetical protein
VRHGKTLSNTSEVAYFSNTSDSENPYVNPYLRNVGVQNRASAEISRKDNILTPRGMSGLRPDLAPPPPQNLVEYNESIVLGLAGSCAVRGHVFERKQQGAAGYSIHHPGTLTWRSEVGTLEKHSRPKPASLFCGSDTPRGRKQGGLARPFRTRRVTIVLASCGLSNTRVRSRAGSCIQRGAARPAPIRKREPRDAGRSPWDASLWRPQFPAFRLHVPSS